MPHTSNSSSSESDDEDKRPLPTSTTRRPSISQSPPLGEIRPLSSAMHAAIPTTGKARLVALQEPQENFHKDEGGKSNQLIFRVILQGEITPEMSAAARDGFLFFNIRPRFDDNTFGDGEILEILGGTESGSAMPALSLKTRLGGIRYRWKIVSKRLNNRKVGVMLSFENLPSIEPIASETTMVYSKRKNRTQRLEEQAKERHELEERQRAAALLLSARSSPDPSPANAIISGAAGGGGFEASQPTSGGSGSSPNKNGESGSSTVGPTQSVNLSAVPLSAPMLKAKFPHLPPQFVPAAPMLVRPRPRRISRDGEMESEDEDNMNGLNDGMAQKRKKARASSASAAMGFSSSTGAGGGANHKPVGSATSRLEERVRKLEACLAANTREIEEMKAAMNICFMQLGSAPQSLRRSVSQNLPWDFGDPNPDTQAAREQMLVAGLTMSSPMPARSPFELEAWGNNNTAIAAAALNNVNGGAANHGNGNGGGNSGSSNYGGGGNVVTTNSANVSIGYEQPLSLRRDMSGSFPTQIPSPRLNDLSAAAMAAASLSYTGGAMNVLPGAQPSSSPSSVAAGGMASPKLPNRVPSSIGLDS